MFTEGCKLVKLERKEKINYLKVKEKKSYFWKEEMGNNWEIS